MIQLPNGGFSFEAQLDIAGEGRAPFVYGEGWMLEIVSLETGKYRFYRNGEAVEPTATTFGIFYPPFSMVSLYVKEVRGSVMGVCGWENFDRMPGEPILFETDRKEVFNNTKEAWEVIGDAKNVKSIPLNSSPSLLSVKAKRLIDEHYRIYSSISKIAERLSVSLEHLSRQFKRDFELSPGKYLHRLRIGEATYKLMKGDEIVNVSGEVGYGDLSRFYKQFRKQHMTSPGLCRKK